MTDNNQTPTPNNKMGIYIAIAVVVVVIIAGGLYALSMNKKSDSDNKSSSSSEVMKSEASVMVGGVAMLESKNIVENASKAPNLSSLVAAVTAGDLVSTLQSPGPFTVFAPTNDAFLKLPAGTVETLLKPESKAALQDILKYHVVSGKLLAKDLKDGQVLKTVQGGNLKVTKKDGKTLVNGAIVETADVVQKNGVVHVIDNILLPTQSISEVGGAMMFANKNIVENATAAPNLSNLVIAVTAGDLVKTLQTAGPFTVFAPDNSAFAKLPAGTVETLLQPESKVTLVGILNYHVVAGKYLAGDLKDGQVLKTVQGGSLTVSKKDNVVTLKDGAGVTIKILNADVLQSNGVVHVIDTILTPGK